MITELPLDIYDRATVAGVEIRYKPCTVKESMGRPVRIYERMFWTDTGAITLNDERFVPKRHVKLLYPGYHDWAFEHFLDTGECCVALRGVSMAPDTWAIVPSIEDAIAFMRAFYDPVSETVPASA